MKPFTEKPLTENMPKPPKGWCFIGFDEELPRSDCKELYAFLPHIPGDSWETGGLYDRLRRPPSSVQLAIAAPEHLCNRLESAAPEPRYRVHVEGKGAPVFWHATFDAAMDEAERLANLPGTMGNVYVYKLAGVVTAEKTVKKERFQ